MKTFVQHISEAGYLANPDHIKSVNQTMKKSGYKKLGRGQDASVWGKEEGSVLKILTSGQSGFTHFYKFCKAHPNNPHLPKFPKISGQEYSEFTMDGEHYLQISIEKLKTIPRNSLAELSIWWFEDSVTKGKTFYEVVKEIQEIKQKTGGFSLKLIQEFQAELQGSKRNDWLLLYSTIQALSTHMKKAKGLGWDLHTENAMMRSDGTVVITDPFTDPSKW